MKTLGVDLMNTVNDSDSEEEPNSFIDILIRRRRKEVKEEDNDLYSPVKQRVPLVFPGAKNGRMSTKQRCKIPHMCDVCWVNDHMYCKNMKRTTRDLLPHGGCLHYVPCEHFSKKAVEEARVQKKLSSLKRCRNKRAKICYDKLPVLKVTHDPNLEKDDVSFVVFYLYFTVLGIMIKFFFATSTSLFFKIFFLQSLRLCVPF